MKKIALLILALIAILMLSGCEVTKTYSSNSTQTVEIPGEHFLFTTDSVDTYLDFLNTFDVNKYEIVDISFVASNSYYCYFVTYKVLPAETTETE